MSSRSTTRNAKPGVMKMSVSPRRRAARRRAPPTRARATSSCRPRRCGRRRRACASIAVDASPRRPRTTRCACGARRGSRSCTGWKVPAPTCSVTLARCTPRASQRGQQRLVEVQRRGRRGHRAGRAREHGLVAPRVVGVVGVRDVGRQRHVAVALQQRERVAAEGAGGTARRPARPAAEHLGVEGAVGEAQRRCPARRLARAQVRHDLVRAGQHALDQRSTVPPVRLLAEQARLDHLGVVEDQQVAGREQRRQLAEDAVDRRGAACRRAGARRCVRRRGAARSARAAGSKSKSARREACVAGHAVGELGMLRPCASRSGRWHAADCSMADAQHAAARQDRSPGPARAMRKLGLVRDIDLALHLPLRYEDETRSCAIADAREGDTAQVEGVGDATASVEFRPRRQLVVTAGRRQRRAACCASCNFYPSQQKTLARGRAGARARRAARRLPRAEMVHPAFKAVDGDTPLAAALTPVYPTQRAAAAGLPAQGGRLGAGARAAGRDCCPPDALPPGAADPARGAAASCTTRRPTWRWPRWRTTATRPGSG